MEFKLIKKVNQVGKEKSFTNYYLVNNDSGITLPIEIKLFKDKEGKIKNKSDLALAWKLSEFSKNEKKN